MEYLEACKRVKAEYPEVRCLLVGPYDSNPSALKSEELQPFIDQGIIEYFGEQTDVRPYLKQCSTYVLPSYHEGMSNVLLEGAASGIPLIASDIPGCQEIIDEGVTGFLCKPRSAKKLAEAIIEFFNLSETERRRMGEKGRENVIREFNRQNVAAKYIGIIRELVSIDT